MSEIFLISDIHLDDKNIILNNRRFPSLYEYRETIIRNWNNVVSKDDIVYDLGDISMSAHPLTIKGFLNQLNGTKYLIKGNHDLLDNKIYMKLGYSYVYDMPIILNDKYILSHKPPKFISGSSPYMAIFGHVHNNIVYRTVSPKSYCVCPERNHYTPVSLSKIRNDIILEAREGGLDCYDSVTNRNIYA